MDQTIDFMNEEKNEISNSIIVGAEYDVVAKDLSALMSLCYSIQSYCNINQIYLFFSVE